MKVETEYREVIKLLIAVLERAQLGDEPIVQQWLLRLAESNPDDLPLVLGAEFKRAFSL